MIELKTLKDIRWHYFALENGVMDVGDYAKIWQLKDEAIKWIKHFKSGEAWTDFAADSRNGQENIEEWIAHFFNITEGDLKNG